MDLPEPRTVTPVAGSKYDGLAEFRSLMDDKLRFGDEKYGADSWVRHDMLAEAMAEMVDLGNYAYLKWQQLKVLQERLDAAGQPRSLTGEDRLGVQPSPVPLTVTPATDRQSRVADARLRLHFPHADSCSMWSADPAYCDCAAPAGRARSAGA